MHRSARLAAFVLAAAAAFGNPAVAADLGAEARAEIEALRTGDMRKLIVHEAAKAPLEASFLSEQGASMTLADFPSELTVVNFWATWCPPCVKEMPSLDRLSASLEGTGVAVVAINVERGGADKAVEWIERMNLTELEAYSDERGRLPREAGFLGLPTTLVVDGAGREVARLQGDAEWDSDEARALLTRLAALLSPGG